MTKPAITVEGLSKAYRIGLKEELPDTFMGAMTAFLKAPARNFRRLRRLNTFQEAGARSQESDLTTQEPAGNGHPSPDDQTPDDQTTRRPGPSDIIWALNDVSFEVPEGEVLGIIGRNGAGKSTLLKVLSRITEPTSGRAVIRGRVSSLLEVGTGFHPELTGRENIYLNGTILGMTRREIDRKFDEIVEFSGVETFLDTPIKRYSSGMKVRLAFSVAAHLDPEILLVDEVLAVGDAAFQRKCLTKMGDVAKEGRTVLFVSHQLDMVRTLCDSCVLLNAGTVEAEGDSETVTDRYIAGYSLTREYVTSFSCGPDTSLPIQVLAGCLKGPGGEQQGTFDVFDPITLELEYIVRRPLEGANMQFELRKHGVSLFWSFDTDSDTDKLRNRPPGRYRTEVTIPCPLLKPGCYTISFRPGIIGVGVIQALGDALVFEVDLLTAPSAFVSYSAKRPGHIAAHLEWKTVAIDIGKEASRVAEAHS